MRQLPKMKYNGPKNILQSLIALHRKKHKVKNEKGFGNYLLISPKILNSENKMLPFFFLFFFFVRFLILYFFSSGVPNRRVTKINRLHDKDIEGIRKQAKLYNSMSCL